MIFLDDNEETRKTVEYCYQKRRTTLNPIIDWEEEDVWEFLNDVVKVPHCSLYDEGFTRLGCIGCPLQGRENMKRDFERWPRYKELYIRAFDQMIKNHPGEIRIANGDSAKPGGVENSQKTGSDGAANGPSELPGQRIPQVGGVQEHDGIHFVENAAGDLGVVGDQSDLITPPESVQMVDRIVPVMVLDWWMWLMRNPKDNDEPSPIK